MAELVKKTLYKGVTIFEYKARSKHYWMLPASRSSTKYTTLAGAKKAVDKGVMRSRR